MPQYGIDVLVPVLNVRQLRDPAVYKEAGCIYLLYTVRGEGGIAMAQLNITSGPVRSAC